MEVAGWEINVCRLMFVAYLLLVGVVGFIVTLEVLPLPGFLQQGFRFGKFAHKGPKNFLVSKIEIPKRWFLHFYVVGSVAVALAGWQAVAMYLLGRPLSPWADLILDFLTSSHRQPAVSSGTALLAVLLVLLHVWRRLAESLWVSVFSSSHINLSHYLLGHTHYLSIVVLLVSRAPGFAAPGAAVSLTGVEGWQLVGVLVYAAGFYIQMSSLRILAALRKDKESREKHQLPVGGLFERVSCPHMFGEVLVYLGILLVQPSHTDWALITVWVTMNQVQIALLNHRWYQDTFKDYPKSRKAIFPFLL